MELERYEALTCAIEKGSLSAAAESLGYTPSGISRMMSALEDETGFPLLLRKRDGVEPTEDCKRMLPLIRELLFHGERCRQMAARIRGLETGAVTVVTAYKAYYEWLSAMVAAFHQEYPNIKIQLRGGYSSELAEMLEQRQADIAIISRRAGGHDWIPLLEDELTAWVPAAHPLAALPAVPLSAFETEAYIDPYPGLHTDNSEMFSRYHIVPNTQFSSMDDSATYAMVAAGLGISMNNAINSSAAGQAVKVLPLEPRQMVEIGIASSHQRSPAADAFLQYLIS